MLVIVDYGVGNLKSLSNALTYLSIDHKVTSTASEICDSDFLILPGVGAFDSAIHRLVSSGLYSLLDKRVSVEKVPVLGICLGMHLFCSSSSEGSLTGFDWVKAKVIEIDNSDPFFPLPHVGWKLIESAKTHETHGKYYFTHSYAIESNDTPFDSCHTITLGRNKYVAAFQVDNIIGCQFHPEKSGSAGLHLLANTIQTHKLLA